MKIRYFVITAVLATAILCFGPSVNAQTADTQALIAQLQAQIAQLLAQIQALQAQQGATPTAWCHDFNVDLDMGNTGSEVSALQTALQKQGFTIASNELNSQIFGNTTGQAVRDFKAKNNSRIATAGTTKVSGRTNRLLNQLYGCGVASFSIPELNIKFKINDKIKDLVYAVSNGVAYGYPYKSAILSTKSLIEASSGGCGLNVSGESALGIITVREKSLSELGIMQGQSLYESNNFFVSYDSPQSVCASNSQTATTLETEQLNILKESLKTVEQNTTQPVYTCGCSDANSDGYISPMDSNVIITLINETSVRANRCTGGSQYDVKKDVNKDGCIDETDTQCVITYLNTYGGRATTCSTQPSITVTSPNGGETLTIGQTYNITWRTVGITEGVAIALDGLTERDSNTGDRYSYLIGTLPFVSTSTSYSWIIPSSIPIGQYKIKIWNTYNADPLKEVIDSSDNYFSIAAATTATCTDSDGGMNYYTKGTAIWGTTGNIATDYCVNSNTLAEYQCAGATSSAIFPTNYTCLNGCENGACKSSTQPSITVTSPNGGETWKIGETKNITWTGTTTAKVSIVAVSDPFVNTGTVTIATNIVNAGSYTWVIPNNFPVYTYHIEVILLDEIGDRLITGKSNRFTVAATAATASCTDSDGGKNYETKGTVSGISSGGLSYSYTDSACLYSNVVEWYCDSNNTPKVDSAYTCPNGCENGACKPATAQPSITVTSPNGGERWEKGYTYDIKWTSKDIQEGVYITLQDYNSSSVIATEIVGPYSNRLSSIDGLNVFTWKVPMDLMGDKFKITVSAKNQTQKPQDTSDNNFGIAVTYTYTCGCSDTNVDGSISPMDSNVIITLINSAPTKINRCRGGSQYDLKMDANKDNCIDETDANCVIADLNTNGSRTTTCGTIGASCTDSDGGNNQFVKGNITGSSPDGSSSGDYYNTDYCDTSAPKTLVEYFCQYNGKASQRYDCPNGCLNGACVASGSASINRESALSSISAAIAKIVQGIQEMLKK